MNFSDILNLFRQGKGTARSHIKNLIEMAAIDGSLDLLEYNLLKKIAKRNNINENQLRAIHDNPAKIKFELPEDRQLKFSQFYDLVHMMSIDNTIHEEEMKLCNVFAVKFGYSREKATDIIEHIKYNIANKEPQEETFRQVEWMLGL